MLRQKTLHSTVKHCVCSQNVCILERNICVCLKTFCVSKTKHKKILKIMNITCKCGVKLLKGVLLCFFSFFKFDSVCHVYDKVTNQSYKSLSPLQKEIIRLKKKSLFKNYNERLVWTTKLFSCICDVTNIIPPTEIRLVGGWWERFTTNRVIMLGLKYNNHNTVALICT